jgi:hypothetical protein
MARRPGGAAVLRYAVAVSLLLSAAPAVAHAAATPRLARMTTITGSRSTSTAVVLPHGATVRVDRPTAHSDNVTVTGNGRVAGFDLRSENGSATPPHLFGVLTNGCYTARCTQREHIVSTVAAGFASKPVGSLTQYTLPAGRYRLILIADGAPVTVRLRLDGLTGSATIRPAATASVKWQPLKPNSTVGTPPALVAYSAPAGVLPVGDRGGILFTVFDVRLSAGDFGQRGFCYYRATNDDRVYTVGCAGAEDESGESVTGLIPQEHSLRALQFLDGDFAAEPGSTGLYYDSVGVVESIDALSVRIAY